MKPIEKKKLVGWINRFFHSSYSNKPCCILIEQRFGNTAQNAGDLVGKWSFSPNSEIDVKQVEEIVDEMTELLENDALVIGKEVVYAVHVFEMARQHALNGLMGRRLLKA